MTPLAAGALASAAAAAATRGQALHLSAADRAGTAVVLAIVGVAVILLGRYGWRRGAGLLPGTVAESQVPHRVAVLRRGAAACVVAGVLVLAAAGIVAAA